MQKQISSFRQLVKSIYDMKNENDSLKEANTSVKKLLSDVLARAETAESENKKLQQNLKELELEVSIAKIAADPVQKIEKSQKFGRGKFAKKKVKFVKFAKKVKSKMKKTMKKLGKSRVFGLALKKRFYHKQVVKRAVAR